MVRRGYFPVLVIFSFSLLLSLPALPPHTTAAVAGSLQASRLFAVHSSSGPDVAARSMSLGRGWIE